MRLRTVESVLVTIFLLIIFSISILFGIVTIGAITHQKIFQKQEKQTASLEAQRVALLNDIHAFYCQTALKAVEVAIASMPGDAIRDMDYDKRLTVLKQSFLLEIRDPIPGCYRLLEDFIFVEMPRYLESNGYFGPEQSNKIKQFSLTPWSVIVYCYNQLNNVRDFYENARVNGATREDIEKFKIQANIIAP